MTTGYELDMYKNISTIRQEAIKQTKALERIATVLEVLALRDEPMPPTSGDVVQPRCIDCHRTPSEIKEYVELAADAGLTPDDFVRRDEGTYNPTNGHFACSYCYIEMGSPVTPAGWKAP